MQAYRLKKRKRCNPDCGVAPYPCKKHPYGALAKGRDRFYTEMENQMPT